MALAWALFIFFLVTITVDIFKNQKRMASITTNYPRPMLLPDITICSENPYQGYLNDEARQNEGELIFFDFIAQLGVR